MIVFLNFYNILLRKMKKREKTRKSKKDFIYWDRGGIGKEAKRFAQLVPDGETKRPTRLMLRRSSAYRWLSAYLPPVFVSADIPEFIRIIYTTFRKKKAAECRPYDIVYIIQL